MKFNEGPGRILSNYFLPSRQNAGIVKDLKAVEQKEIFAVLTDDQRANYLKAKGVETPVKDKASEKK